MPKTDREAPSVEEVPRRIDLLDNLSEMLKLKDKDYHSVWKGRVEWIKWKWEFLRRNKRYISDYKRIKACGKAGNRIPSIEIAEMCENYGLSGTYLIDPSKSFDDLMGNVELDFDDSGEASISNPLFVNHLRILSLKRPKAVNAYYWNTEKSKLIIEMDFSKLNSSGALKRLVAKLIDEHKDRLTERKRRNMTDYGTYIKVGDLKDKEGLTFEQIAQKEFSRQDPESGLSWAKQCYKKYKELVGGGYKDLTYP